MIEAYLIHLLILIAIYAVLAVSLNIAVGYTGLLNLGHVAFFGIGAYTSAILAGAGMPFFVGLLGGAALAGIVGIGVTSVTRKLNGDYLALATLGLAFIAHSVFLNWTSVTGGAYGMIGILKPNIFGVVLLSPLSYLIFTLVIAAICITLMWLAVKSPFGRLLEATRDDATGLRALGKNTYALQWKAMAISAFFAGIAGSLYAHYIGFIDANTFYIADILLLVTIVIAGGLATIRGSILATVIILAIPEILRFFALPSSVLGPARQIIYGTILIIILLYKPRGLLGRIDLA